MGRKQPFGPSRIDFDDSIDKRDVDHLALDPRLKVVQMVAPVSARTVGLLNDRLFATRPDVEFRVYGHYSDDCDLRLVRQLANVRRFAADSLMRAKYVETVAELQPLDSLSIGIYELNSFEFLNHVSPSLSRLAIGATRSSKPDLSRLQRFEQLKVLYVEGHSKTVPIIETLANLEDLTLRSVTTPGLDYVRPLKRLWSLDIKLGGIKSLDAIRGMSGIKYLELWQILGLADISVIADLPGLQNLFLQSLARVKGFPDLRRASRLRRIVVENMKGLTDFSALESAPALEEFAHIDAKGKQPTDLLPVLRNRALLRMAAGFGSDKKNQEFAKLRDEHGKGTFNFAPFQYAD